MQQVERRRRAIVGRGKRRLRQKVMKWRPPRPELRISALLMGGSRGQNPDPSDQRVGPGKANASLGVGIREWYYPSTSIRKKKKRETVRHPPLRVARTGHDNDQGGRRLWIRSDATYLQRAPRRRQWLQRRACLLRKLVKEQLPCPSTKKAPFASTMRRPVPASRCCLSPAGD